MSRAIDGAVLTEWISGECKSPSCPKNESAFGMRIIKHIEGMQTIEPERKKDTIQKFHDYQVEWLLAHCDLELEPQLEEWVVRFLHDTANCYMMEIDRGEGEQDV